MPSKKEKNNVLFPKYWANRTLIFAIIGMVPLLSGVMFLIMGFELNEKAHKSNSYEIDAYEICKDHGQNDFEIVLKIEGQTIRDTLKYHDDWYNLLDVYGNPGIRQRVLNKENIEFAINKIKAEKPVIKVYQNEKNNKIIGLKVDMNTIVPYSNFLLMGVFFTALGIFLVGGSLYIVIKDPNQWYKDNKHALHKNNV